MYALLTAVPFVGHLNPLLAQAGELQRRGWRVAIASTTEAARHVASEAPHLPFIDLGPLGERRAAIRRDEEAASRDSDFRRAAFRLGRTLLHAWEPMFDGLAAAIAADRPDVVISDLFSQAGICAAQAAGVPLVVNNPAILHMLPPAIVPPLPNLPSAFSGRSIREIRWADRLWARIAPYSGRLLSRANGDAALNAMRAARGLPPADTSTRLRHTLILVDDAFGFEYERALPPLVKMVGPMLPGDVPPLPDDVAAWLADGPPVVYANLGTVAIPPAPLLAAMRTAFESTDCRVLWIMRGADAARLPGPVPANVRVVEWGPMPRAVLASPHVRAFVSHCGPNSVRESLLAGTPIVGIPFFADQIDIAVRLADAGVGVWLRKHRVTAAELRQAIERVLNDRGVPDRVREVQSAFARAGGVARAADLIEQAVAAGVQAG